MGLEKVIEGKGGKGFDGGVGGGNTTGFGNFAGGGQNAFSGEADGDLVFGEGVAIDGDSAPNGGAMFGLAEPESVRAFEEYAIAISGGNSRLAPVSLS